jgi:FkbM family methyltransferase
VQPNKGIYPREWDQQNKAGMSKQFDTHRLNDLVAMLRPERRTRIVDVGANPINENPYLKLLQSGHAEVWGFEPNPVAFARLAETDTEHYFPHAVGDGSKQTLYITKAPAFTSLYRPNAAVFGHLGQMGRASTVLEEVEIETRALDDIPGLPDFDLLKIDVEGAETLVFEGAKDKLSRAVAVISEVAFLPLSMGQPLLDEQMRILRGHGFDFQKFLGLSNFTIRGPLAVHLSPAHHRDQAVNGDASFLRSLLAPEAIETEQLKHMAILCDAVLNSFALVARCLEFLIARDVTTTSRAIQYLKQVPHSAD